MTTDFEIFTESQTKPGKIRCGDSYQYKILNGNNKELLLLVVSDGVSTSKDDHLASNTTCETIIKEFQSSSGYIKERMTISVENTNSEVRNIDENFGNHSATLLFVIWEINENKIYYVSVGDSRIFKYSNNEFELLTEDDKESVLLKIGGETVMVNGTPKFAQALTKYMGMVTRVEKDIFETNFFPGESIILATDGIHNNGNLPGNLKDIIESNNLEKELKIFVNDCKETFDDDSTIVILRRKYMEKDFKEIIESVLQKKIDFRSKNIPILVISDYFIRKILELLRNTEKEDIYKELKQILQYILSFRIIYQRKIFKDLYSEFLKLNVKNLKIHNLFLDIIRKSTD